MPLDINAFRLIANQNPDKLVYAQGESLKTTRNAARPVRAAAVSALDARLP